MQKEWRATGLVIAGLVLGCARPVDATSDRAAVLAAIKRFSGKYEVDENHPERPVVELSLNHPYTKLNPLAPVWVSDEDLAVLGALPALQKLTLRSTAVTT